MRGIILGANLKVVYGHNAYGLLWSKLLVGIFEMAKLVVHLSLEQRWELLRAERCPNREGDSRLADAC